MVDTVPNRSGTERKRETPSLRAEAEGLAMEILALHRQRERDDVERTRIERRFEALIRELDDMKTREKGPGPNARVSRLMPVAGREAVYAWLADRSAGRRTVSWLAERIGKSRPHLQEILAGYRNVSPELATLIAKETGIAVELLLPVTAVAS